MTGVRRQSKESEAGNVARAARLAIYEGMSLERLE
jgi:hypothetical protein